MCPTCPQTWTLNHCVWAPSAGGLLVLWYPPPKNFRKLNFLCIYICISVVCLFASDVRFIFHWHFGMNQSSWHLTVFIDYLKNRTQFGQTSSANKSCLSTPFNAFLTRRAAVTIIKWDEVKENLILNYGQPKGSLTPRINMYKWNTSI